MKNTKVKFNLQWCKVSMSCQKLTNLREIFQMKLSRKLRTGVTPNDFKHEPCNCRLDRRACISGQNNLCRSSTTVQKFKCINPGKVCMQNAQQKFKSRMQPHLSEVKMLTFLEKECDLCAKHFATQFVDSTALWILNTKVSSAAPHGNRNQSMQPKHVLTKNSSLSVCPRKGCNSTAKQSGANPQLLVNSNNKTCSRCVHNSRF